MSLSSGDQVVGHPFQNLFQEDPQARVLHPTSPSGRETHRQTHQENQH